MQADTLREAGYRFVYRLPRGWFWAHPSDLTGEEIDATELSDNEFEEAVRGTETTMTQTMLERAAEAVRTAMGGDLPSINDCRHVARAVLMAVRVPGEAMSQAVRTTEGWEDMIDAILNEPQR